MPDANGKVRGSGWTRKQAAGWERAFDSATQRPRPATMGGPAPSPSKETTP